MPPPLLPPNMDSSPFPPTAGQPFQLPPLRWFEPLLFMTGVAAVLAAVLTATGTWDVFSRPFGTDELITSWIVTAPTWEDGLATLRDGVDTNPPLLHATLRWAWVPFFGGQEAALRGFSCVCVLLAITGLFTALRFDFGRAAAAVGAAAPLTLQLVQLHAVQARFYAPWLALLAWLVVMLRVRADRGGGAGLGVMTALLALAVCWMHYFGVISVGLVGVGVLLLPLGWRERWRLAWPLALGPIGTLACVPLLLAQRAALDAPTWVPGLTWARAESLVLAQLPWVALGGLLVIALIAAFAGWRQAGATARGVAGDVRRQAPLLMTLGMPWALMGIDVLLQPVGETRYAIAATLGASVPAAALVAVATRLAGRRAWLPATAAWVVLGAAGIAAWNGQAQDTYRWADAARAVEGGAAAIPPGARLLTANTHLVFQLNHIGSPLAARVALAHVEHLPPPAATDRAAVLSHGWGAAVIRHFPQAGRVQSLEAVDDAEIWVHQRGDVPSWIIPTLEARGYRTYARIPTVAGDLYGLKKTTEGTEGR